MAAAEWQPRHPGEVLLQTAIIHNPEDAEDHWIVFRCVTQKLPKSLAQKIARGARREFGHRGHALLSDVAEDCSC